MTERMTSADVAFLHRETRTAPQHVGGLAVFAPRPGGFEYDRLVRLLEERISLAPRYRQKVRMVPGHLANPLWLDDPGFDITYHVRRSALPRPGTDAQLLEFCARIQSRLLDRSRPLWEMYLVEGLADGRVAVVTKTHEAMVDETARHRHHAGDARRRARTPAHGRGDLDARARAGLDRPGAHRAGGHRASADRARRHRARSGARRPVHRRQGRLGHRWRRVVGAGRGAAAQALAADRPAERAAAHRHRPHPAGRLPAGAQRARRRRQRRGAGGGGRRAARLAARPRRTAASRRARCARWCR